MGLNISSAAGLRSTARGGVLEGALARGLGRAQGPGVPHGVPPRCSIRCPAAGVCGCAAGMHSMAARPAHGRPMAGWRARGVHVHAGGARRPALRMQPAMASGAMAICLASTSGVYVLCEAGDTPSIKPEYCPRQ